MQAHYRTWFCHTLLTNLAFLQVEKPTVRMTFSVNTSPFAGREGKYVTSRNIKDRLERELERNLALTVEPGETADRFVVSGRGALHISILIENMRREGFEFQVGPPKVRHLLWTIQSSLSTCHGSRQSLMRVCSAQHLKSCQTLSQSSNQEGIA
jgi:predicted membrane GTPase involved in stress response